MRLKPRQRGDLSCAQVAAMIHDFGIVDPLPRDDGALAYILVVVFEPTNLPLGDCPQTTADLEEIRYEHRALCEAGPSNTAPVAAELVLQ